MTKVGYAAFGIHYAKYTYEKYGYSYLTLVFQGSAPSFNDSWSDTTGGSEYLVKYPVSEASSWKKLDLGWAASMKSYKLSVKSAAAAVTLSSTSYSYTGNKKTPSVSVVVNGETLTKGTDYTLTWSSSKRTAVGKYTVKIKGTGDYSGTVTKTFKIKPAKVTLKSSTKSSSSKKLTVKWSKLTSGTVTKYQIRYRYKTSSGYSSWKTKTVSSSKSSYTLSSLKSGKTYQVQVRAYKTVSGTKYYGSWSSKKTVKVK